MADQMETLNAPPVRNGGSHATEEVEEWTSPAIVSKFGKPIPKYWIRKPQAEVATSREGQAFVAAPEPPPFAVIGMGRCGCHVTAALAQVITVASGRKTPGTEPESSWNLVAKLFRADDNSGVLRLEPVMLIGDIDVTTYADISGLLREEGSGPKVADRILKFNFTPLAIGGAGHVPLFAEYITRGLLVLPPGADGAHEEAKWTGARDYLIDTYLRSPQQARLVFYIFSAGGGTGSGAALELIRAQRYALNCSTGPEPQVYFTAFAVLPADLSTSNRRQINTGRLLVRYLADLNIKLDGEEDYGVAQVFQSRLETQNDEGARILLPWDSMALVSNDVMFIEGSQGASREKAETVANQYMAQQMFNLAASQFQTEEYDRENASRPTSLNYQSIRLDPQDLRNGLNGPYAIAFGAAHPDETGSPGWVEHMFLRAIDLPSYHDAQANELVEGISVAPEAKRTYGEKIKSFASRLKQKESPEGPAPRLTEDMFEELQDMRLFSACPRAVFVLTVPQEGIVPAQIEERLFEYIGWLLPNADTIRSAIVRGTTRYYTFSLYIESSVVLCPDVLVPIMNYIKLCWPKTRGMKAQEFTERFNALIAQPPPLRDEDIREWLGETEHYGANVPNFKNLAESHERNWRNYAARHPYGATNAQDDVKGLDIESVYLTPEEVAAALRFVNYVYHNRTPETVEVGNFLV